MPETSPTLGQAWLEAPLRTSIGELQLAGVARDARGLDPKTMRVLGSYALVYLLEVDGYYRDANGYACDLSGGDLVLIMPELAHAYGPKEGQSWQQIYFVFNGPQFDLWRAQGLLAAAPPVWRLEPVDYWGRRMAEIVAPEEGHTPAAALRAVGRFSALLSDALAARVEATEGPATATWLEASQRLLGSPGARRWATPQEVAAAVGLSYDNFRKQFTARVGQSPGQFQKRRKIDRAGAAIYHGSHGFKALAEELEFCDVFHFSKAFKQVMGMSPSEFRRRAHGG
ncbi:AraC family transcriptional regulator [Horticoccus luteus]|uniref:AraC family transcriptional regulator n=1 Tax=Horticoccus luteus TaxID=2862869 RepID=A0A8F9TW68_9BACT|nr:AraC family transcriptional regulator [Horticoccus luteus]QYM78692.1 AraC family transcriptional regulator [Horticoccus luteus]